MKKDLPKVFANPIDKEIRNNTDIYYSQKENLRSTSTQDVSMKIKEIFASVHHVYKSNVLIKTKNGSEKTTIVGKTGNYLLTLDGRKINILDIQDIARI